MMIDVGDFVLLKYGDMEILKAVLTSHEKMLQDSGTSGAIQISEDSPVGRAIKGRGQGEQFEVEVDGKKSIYQILGVEKGFGKKVKLTDT